MKMMFSFLLPITKEESQDEKNYVDGKPDYADAFEDNLIFKWDSQIGKGLDSSYMKVYLKQIESI